MNTITRPLFFILILGTVLPYGMMAQETPEPEVVAIPVEGIAVTTAHNSFIDYHDYILKDGQFRFRKELKKVKHDTNFLEYASDANNIRISKYDYLKMMRRAVNQSDTKGEFMALISDLFVDKDQSFAEQVDFASLYDATRPHTFHGYFDGLPRIR